MSYQYKIIISNRTVYKEFEISTDMEKVKLGTTTGCEFRLNSQRFFESIELELEKNHEKWSMSCAEPIYISRGDMRKLFSTDLEHGDVLSLRYAVSGDEAFELRFMIDFEADIPNYNWKVNIANLSEITIGNDATSNLILKSRVSNNNMVRLYRKNHTFALEEIHTDYGVYINGRKMEQTAILNESDFFSIANSFFYYREKQLIFDKKDTYSNDIPIIEMEEKGSFQYPMFVRNTRAKIKIDETPISILDPIAVPQKPELNILTSLMPTLVMFVLVVVFRGIMSTSTGSYVLFSICSMGMGVAASALSIMNSHKKFKSRFKERKTKYYEYIEKKKEEIANARQQELECLNETYYSSEQVIENIINFRPQLFDRTVQDEDFLDVYLGRGRVEARRKIDYKKQEKLETEDELCELPTRISNDFKYISYAPVVLKLKGINAVGIVGQEEQRYNMFKCILLDIVGRQYYGDVRIYLLLEKKEEKYQWLRQLPNIQNMDGMRNIVFDNESKNNIFEHLYKELAFRSANPSGSYVQNVVLVLNEQEMKSHPISKFIETAGNLNTVFVFFEAKEEYLPLHCGNIVKMTDDRNGILYASEDKTNKQVFQYTKVSDIDMEKIVNKLAPVYCEEMSLENSLRKSISLFELLGIYSVEDLDIGLRWGQSQIYQSMAVPLGINVKDEVVYLNLHEKAHGPHGLVAGTTGSGKSEILQSYILAASTLFHPTEIGFVIIDFKGGGMVNQFKDLPHLIGAITNIDGKEIERFLRSIKAELLKRQNLFAEAEVNHIDKYIKAYQEGKVKTALPHLIIIVDEFAELKAEQPEFMKELISAARIGRSLGVHLILATQKPAGQVNEQIWSNSRFKLCLKVQTQEDSNEVLKSPLAAEIREPGRAYLQVGNNEIFEIFQSGYSGSPEQSDDSKMKEITLNKVGFGGNRTEIYKQKAEQNVSARTQLEAVVEYINQYCKDKGISKLSPICMPSLQKKIAYDVPTSKKNIQISCVLGIYDDPDSQYQGKYEVELAAQNVMIVGASQYGKTNLLEVMIRNLADIYSPEEVNLYMIDFGSMVLKTFEKLCHVGGVVCPSDDEKLKNLFKYLNDQIPFRREKMLSAGVSSFVSYKEAGYTDLPQIIVFIDNLTVLRELYLQDNDILLNISREGVSVGITFIVANSQTNGIGYRYFANFATRIALFCNEMGEYSTLFGSCKLTPKEISGRCIVEIDKSLYECQTYLAFEGDKEIDRVRNMQLYIEDRNKRNDGMHAELIPEIPDTFTGQYVFEKFAHISVKQNRIMLGLNYETVSPIIMELLKTNLLAVSGREGTGKTNFIKYFMNAFCANNIPAEIVIYDDYRKKLKDFQEKAIVTSYSIGTDHLKDTLKELDNCLLARYESLIHEETADNTWKILIINNQEAALEIGKDNEMLNIFKNAIGKSRMLHVFILVAGLPNAPIPYGAPEVYKLIKENMNILFFDDLENCKFTEIPLNIVRKNKKKIELGDAYYFLNNDCYKIRTPLAVMQNTI